MLGMPGIIAVGGATDGSLGSAVFLASLVVIDDELELLIVPAGSVGFLRYARWQG
jgi:hypothetical protein